MTDGFKIGTLTIKVVQKRIKHTHLAVYPPDGRVRLSVPMGISDEQIRLYVLQKLNWITEKRKRFATYVVQKEREFVSGEEHFYRGQSYRLKVETTEESAKIGVVVQGDYLVMTVRKDAPRMQRANLLADWYAMRLREQLEPMIRRWEAILHVKVEKWDVKRVKTRWGSCNFVRHVVHFNRELAKVHAHCVDYVVMHELLHLIERTHNENFQRLCFAHMPDWKERRRELNMFPLSGGNAHE